jgi:hypothetical protein
VENLKRKFKLHLSGNSNYAYLIEPCDLLMRFRKNLNPLSSPEIPKSTIVMDISSFIVNIDEEVYKDV